VEEMIMVFYIGVGVAILGLVVCAFAIWALVSKRYKNYADIVGEHKGQVGRVTKTIVKGS
jgi:hypothetical protein